MRLWGKRHLWSHLKLTWGAELGSSGANTATPHPGPQLACEAPTTYATLFFFMRSKILKSALLSGVPEAEQ